MSEFNFKSAICTSREQSERLCALGLKKETADMYYQKLNDKWTPLVGQPFSYGGLRGSYLIPAWSLHRLIEILDTNPYVFYINCGYDTVIDHVEEYIKSGFIDTRYLEEWCLNEEE